LTIEEENQSKLIDHLDSYFLSHREEEGDFLGIMIMVCCLVWRGSRFGIEWKS
jgi:hypothetical protein